MTRASVFFLALATMVSCGADSDRTSSTGQGGGAGLAGAGASRGTGGALGGSAGTGAAPSGGSGGVPGQGGVAGAAGSGGTPASIVVQPCWASPATYATPLGTCDAGGWCWEAPRPNGLATHAMWGASETNVWAAQDEGTLHWDGVSWSTSSAPGGRGVWGTAANDVWIVGETGIHHFDGVSWSPTNVTDPYHSVHGSAANNVWATSDSGDVVQWNGSIWSSMSNLEKGSARDVWTTASDDVWATVGSSLFHFDGSSWTKMSPGGLSSVRALWGSGPNDVWIGGSASSGGGAVVRWNGSIYTPVPVPPGGVGIEAISGTTGSNVWLAAGSQAYHFDGTSLSQSKFTEGFTPGGLWAPPTGHPWAFSGPFGAMKHLERWDGNDWQASEPVITSGLWDVWGNAWNDVWAVGQDTMAHFDGTVWKVTSMPGADLKAVWGTSANEVYAVGFNNLQRWDGTSWSKIATAPEGLHDVWGTGTSDVWIAGTTRVWRWDGTTLAQVGGIVEPEAIWAGSPSEVWIARPSGVARYDGVSWNKVNLSIPLVEQDFRTIWGRAQNDVWVGGDYGVHHWDGSGWTQFSGAEYAATSIWGCGNDTVAILSSGELRLSKGTGFESLAIQGGLGAGVWGASPDHLLVVGLGGQIRRRAQ